MTSKLNAPRCYSTQCYSDRPVPTSDWHEPVWCNGTLRLLCDFECAGNTGHPKGYNIRLVADRNHLEHPVYVGDIDGDRVASEEAGVPFCHASYGFGEVDHADYVIKNFSELKSIFE